MPLSQLYCTGDKGVLRRTVDEWCTFQSAGDREDGGRRDLLVSSFDCVEQIVCSVIDFRNDVCIAFGVGSPENNNFIKIILGFEGAARLLVTLAARTSNRTSLPNVLADLLNMIHAGLATWQNIIRSIFLIRSDEVRIVDAGQRMHQGHFFAQ